MKINLISIKARVNELYQTWLELELRRWLSTVAFLVCHIPWGKRIKSPSFCFPSPGILWPNNSQTQLLASFIFPRFPLTLFPPSLCIVAVLFLASPRWRWRQQCAKFCSCSQATCFMLFYTNARPPPLSPPLLIAVSFVAACAASICDFITFCSKLRIVFPHSLSTYSCCAKAFHCCRFMGKGEVGVVVPHPPPAAADA